MESCQASIAYCCGDVVESWGFEKRKGPARMGWKGEWTITSGRGLAGRHAQPFVISLARLLDKNLKPVGANRQSCVLTRPTRYKGYAEGALSGSQGGEQWSKLQRLSQSVQFE